MGPEPGLSHLEQLETPDFMDFQDFVSPVFRLDLLLNRDDFTREGESRPRQAAVPRFSLTDQEILSGFSALLDRLVGSFSDFQRPEFCKIEELRVGELNQNGNSQATGKVESSAAEKRQSSKGAAEQHRPDSTSYSCAVQQDFEALLYSGAEGGPDAYNRFIGRLRTKEAGGLNGNPKEYVRRAKLQAAVGGAHLLPVLVN